LILSSISLDFALMALAPLIAVGISNLSTLIENKQA
jgi:hypothetical protein